MTKDPAPGAQPSEPRAGLHRRDLLKVGAAGAATAGAASSGGCAVLDALGRTDLVPRDRPLTEHEVTDWCKRLDVGLLAIEKGQSLSHLMPGVDLTVPEERAEAKRVDGLGRQALRGLTFASMYTHLPPANREHPAVQARVKRLQPELDEAILSMTAELAAQSSEDNASLQADLKRDPDTPLKLAAFFDAPAKELGVPRQSRKQMKRILGNVGWRLQRQSPDTVFAEYVTKVKKIAGRSGQLEELKRHVATASFERSLFAPGQVPVTTGTRGAIAMRKTGETPVGSTSPARRKPKPLETERQRGLRRAGRELTSGGVLLGVGLATFGAGIGALFGGLFTGAVMMTVGGAVLLAGIITLIVGAVRRSRARRK